MADNSRDGEARPRRAGDLHVRRRNGVSASGRFGRAQRMVPEVKTYGDNYPWPVVAIDRAGAAAYTLVSGANGARGMRPVVVSRPDGRFLAVWQREQRDGFGVFRAVRIEAAGASPAGRWSAPVTLATAALPEQLGAPAAAVTGSGDVAVAWVRFGGDPAVPAAAMQVTVKAAHGRFTPAQTLAMPGELATDQFGPAVAAGAGVGRPSAGRADFPTIGRTSWWLIAARTGSSRPLSVSRQRLLARPSWIGLSHGLARTSGRV
jgi:hypothetical protein